MSIYIFIQNWLAKKTKCMVYCQFLSPFSSFERESLLLVSSMGNHTWNVGALRGTFVISAKVEFH